MKSLDKYAPTTQALMVGHKLYLINEKGKRTLEKFTLLSVGSKGIRLAGKDGRKLRVHPSRAIAPSILPKAPKDPVASKPAKKAPVKKSPSTKPKKKEVKTMPDKKKKKDAPAFDVSAFVKEHGGEHWTKGESGEKVNFDHDAYKVVAHSLIADKKGRYYVFNTYKYPSGTVSLGKNGTGVTEYPLKGHKVSYTVSQTAKKVESRGQKKTRKGSKTADQVRKTLERKGYRKAK